MEKKTENGKKWIVIAVVFCVILIGICIIVACINKSMCDEVRSTLVGRTFSGTYTYNGTSTFSGTRTFTIRDTYTVEFTDETKCNITVHYTTDSTTSTIEDRDETKTYKDVPYTISGGLGGIELVWDENLDFLYDGLSNGQEPFTVDISGESITIWTKHFMSDNSLRLSER